jgi:hypothetical protein
MLAFIAALHGGRERRAISFPPYGENSQNLPSIAIYDPNPNHIWNRIFRVFYIRQGWDGRSYGGDELDPYLWDETKYLIEGSSHKNALALLDEFLSTHAERLIADPLNRATFQHDLWAVNSWLTRQQSGRKPAADELRQRVIQIMHRVALTPEQIRALPDNYAAAISGNYPVAYRPERRADSFLPPDLFDPKGPWVCMGIEKGKPAASAHTSFVDGRSVFFVLLRLPGGREATLAYLRQLHDFPAPMIPYSENLYTLIHQQGSGSAGVGTGSVVNRVPNPSLPQFPIGTQVALVRRMNVIDVHGEWTPTSVTESVQLRVFTNIPPREDWLADRADPSQDIFEFRISRPDLFGGNSGGLLPISKTDMEFPVFLTMPFDWPTQRFGATVRGQYDSSPSSKYLRPILDSCVGCHAAPGIHSMLAPRTIWSGLAESHSLFFESSPEEQIAIARAMESKQEGWGELKRLWK